MKIQLIDYGLKYRPMRKHYNDAGLDVKTQHEARIPVGGTTKIPLGFGIRLPDSMMGLVLPRSGLSSLGLHTEIPPIDSGYTGEIHALLSVNLYFDSKLMLKDGIEYDSSKSEIVIAKDTRIAQLVVLPIVIPDFTMELGEKRGKNGFGSSGTK